MLASFSLVDVASLIQRLQACCRAIADQIFGHWTCRNDSNILQMYKTDCTYAASEIILRRAFA